MEHQLYSSRDMVRIQCAACAGCGECCRQMGDSILLDPYDVYCLCQGLGKSFMELNGKEIGLHVEEGMILPHLNMEPGMQACAFLDAAGKCTVHTFRPGLCRLYPLGREYDGTGFKYFIVEGACNKPQKSKVRIESWLGITDLKKYEEYVTQWHYFVRDARNTLSAMKDEEYMQKLNLFFLQVFFAAPYDPEGDFYHLFGIRLKQARSLLE